MLACQMPPRRARQYHSLLRAEDKARCLAGWLLLRRFLGKGARSLRFGRYGKPFLPGGPYFSLAHSGRYAVLAVAPVPAGIDIERHNADMDCIALASMALHAREKHYLAAGGHCHTFFDIWTLKESYLKMRGTGLMDNPAAFALLLEGAGARLPERPAVRLRLYADLPGYSAALCLHGGQPPEKLILYKPASNCLEDS